MKKWQAFRGQVGSNKKLLLLGVPRRADLFVQWTGVITKSSGAV